MAAEIPECYKWANDLKVGDVVFISSRGGLSKSKVTKLTATQIVVGDHDCRYQRASLSRRIDSWSSDDLVQATPEVEAQYARQQTVRLNFTLSHDIYNNAVLKSAMEKMTMEQLAELRGKLQDVISFCKMAGVKNQ